MNVVKALKTMDLDEQTENYYLGLLENARLSEAFVVHTLPSDVYSDAIPFASFRLVDELECVAVAMNLHFSFLSLRERVLTSACELLQALAFHKKSDDTLDASVLFSALSKSFSVRMLRPQFFPITLISTTGSGP